METDILDLVLEYAQRMAEAAIALDRAANAQTIAEQTRWRETGWKLSKTADYVYQQIARKTA